MLEPAPYAQHSVRQDGKRGGDFLVMLGKHTRQQLAFLNGWQTLKADENDSGMNELSPEDHFSKNFVFCD